MTLNIVLQLPEHVTSAQPLDPNALGPWGTFLQSKLLTPVALALESSFQIRIQLQPQVVYVQLELTIRPSSKGTLTFSSDTIAISYTDAIKLTRADPWATQQLKQRCPSPADVNPTTLHLETLSELKSAADNILSSGTYALAHVLHLLHQIAPALTSLEQASSPPSSRDWFWFATANGSRLVLARKSSAASTALQLKALLDRRGQLQWHVLGQFDIKSQPLRDAANAHALTSDALIHALLAELHAIHSLLTRLWLC